MSSSSGCSPLAAVGFGVLLSLGGVAACADGAGDGAGSTPASSDDATTHLAVDLPVATIPVDVPTGLERYTDRGLDLNSIEVPKTGRDSASAARKAADARRAGPASIASDALIIDRAAEVGGAMLPLPESRSKGQNGWVCVPDDPVTPVDDPVCLNRMAQRWASGVYTGRDSFRHEGLGVGYKLRGGALASNTDPYLIRPLEGDSWIIEPPHVILIFQDTTGLGALPDDPGQGGPWVSWLGTPYAHVKVPIAP